MAGRLVRDVLGLYPLYYDGNGGRSADPTALAVRAGGLEPVALLLADDVVTTAVALPGSALVSDAGDRKGALRRAGFKRRQDEHVAAFVTSLLA